jgi:hypothetical protein
LEDAAQLGNIISCHLYSVAVGTIQEFLMVYQHATFVNGHTAHSYLSEKKHHHGIRNGALAVFKKID